MMIQSRSKFIVDIPRWINSSLEEKLFVLGDSHQFEKSVIKRKILAFLVSADGKLEIENASQSVGKSPGAELTGFSIASLYKRASRERKDKKRRGWSWFSEEIEN